jgi:endoglycosylceramidase
MSGTVGRDASGGRRQAHLRGADHALPPVDIGFTLRDVRDRVLVSIMVGFGLLGYLPAAGASSPASSAELALPELLRLRATHGADARIVDAQGREVLLRGVNLSALGDYYLSNPVYPAPVPLRPNDFADIAAQGFDVVRLLVSWSAFEPERDVIAEDYLDQIRGAVAGAKAQGLHVIVDMHQDAWGKYIASPPGTICAPGTNPANGWDGAPEWATLFDPGPNNENTCTPGSREDSSAAKQAWDNFYADTDGIMSELVEAWGTLGAAFANEPAVAGYDLLNEPNLGTDGDNAARQLGVYFDRAIGAIREAEQAAGGFSHIAIFETTVVGTTVPYDFTTDQNIVFSGHNYGDSITPIPMDVVFNYFDFQAEQYGAPLWIGEYGWFSDPESNAAKALNYGSIEDAMILGSAWWQWIQACGDPHSIGSPGGTPAPLLIHYKASECPGDVDLGPVPQWQLVTSRPYPRATPGGITTLTSDASTSTMTVMGQGEGTFDVWVPERGTGVPTVGGANIADIEVVDVEGGWRVLGVACDAYAITVNTGTSIDGGCASDDASTAPVAVTPRFTG